ncbi:copper-binding protein [Rheinheimera sp. F8]|jgi:Cu(I)/Ag(I) efflux system protein CusF|uniref:copper-binding protein n=1 Tax=Rheinheimera sp. F8 TaxID=1763998 RepID=UPI000744D21B|nr:copper-binding protein [Rheinheimera sp. F8]ALZ74779.1 copper-binding protein [Rheinheimera sp. F8]
MKTRLTHLFAAMLVLSPAVATAQSKAMEDMPMETVPATQTVHVAKGKVTKVDMTAGVVTLTHDPIQSLNWPAMTMGFKVKDKRLLDKLVIGKIVIVELAHVDKTYVITNVK